MGTAFGLVWGLSYRRFVWLGFRFFIRNDVLLLVGVCLTDGLFGLVFVLLLRNDDLLLVGVCLTDGLNSSL